MKMKSWKIKHWQSWIWNFVILNFWWHTSLIHQKHPLLVLEHSQGCWAGHHPCLGFVQWILSLGKPKCGFTPVCTVAKGLVVAFSFPSSLQSQNHQTQTFTSTEASWLIITGQCYIKDVRAESVCLSSHLRMDSDSGTISPGPGWPNGKLDKSEIEKGLAIWTDNHTR